MPGLGWLFGGVVRWWSHLNRFTSEPEDQLSHQISQLIQQDSAQRDHLTCDIYYPEADGEALKRLEVTFKAVKSAEATEKKIRKAVKEKRLPKIKGPQLLQEALKAGVITEVEAANLKKAEELRLDAITVDDFSQAEYLGNSAEVAVKSA